MPGGRFGNPRDHVASPRQVRRHHGVKSGQRADPCGARHPFRKGKDGLLLQCDRAAEHRVQHHAKTKAGDVWW